MWGTPTKILKRKDDTMTDEVKSGQYSIPSDPYLWDSWDGIRHLRQTTLAGIRFLSRAEQAIKDKKTNDPK